MRRPPSPTSASSSPSLPFLQIPPESRKKHHELQKTRWLYLPPRHSSNQLSHHCLRNTLQLELPFVVKRPFPTSRGVDQTGLLSELPLYLSHHGTIIQHELPGAEGSMACTCCLYAIGTMILSPFARRLLGFPFQALTAKVFWRLPCFCLYGSSLGHTLGMPFFPHHEYFHFQAGLFFQLTLSKDTTFDLYSLVLSFLLGISRSLIETFLHSFFLFLTIASNVFTSSSYRKIFYEPPSWSTLVSLPRLSLLSALLRLSRSRRGRHLHLSPTVCLKQLYESYCP